MAAIDTPIAGGKVELLCQGASVALSTVTSAAGAWQIDTTGQSLPCAVKITGGSLSTGQSYHSAVLAFDNINITPLTDLMVASASGKLPAVWWSGNGPSDLSGLTPAALEKALVALRTGLGLDALKSLDPLTAQFTPVAKDKLHDILQAFRLALSQTGIDYSGLLSSAASGSFVVPESFRISLANNYSTIVNGPSTDIPGPGGNYTLTLNVTASGMSMAPISIANVPKPSSQAEFCGWVNDPASNVSLSQVNSGGAGSITINSCSFSGNVGQVSATMTITSPISMTVPYSVTYTYN
ncbi:hypothetical protein [Ottowia thiooxydans]|uniref:hypothetical protein n=1 Tax=Ottowia thiooxydans TaxID=219182 RepID=UPI0004906365|nr:hypothetical protein [Ottowia thiooxydans]